MRKFVRTQTRARWKKLRAELRRASGSPRDPEAIHDLRVAIRRFVQCLRHFQQFFDAPEVKRIRKPLRKLMKRCGEVRNRDIAMGLLCQAGLTEAPVMRALERQRMDAEKELVRTLRAWRKRKNCARSLKVEQGGEGPWDAGSGPAENARRVLPQDARKLFEAGDAAAAPGAAHDAMHQFRLSAKRFRYTLEIFQPVYEARKADMKRGLDGMRGLQDRLGAINDCVTACELLKDDEAAVAAIDKIVPGREAEFRRFWKARFGLASRKRWIARLSAAEKD